jgi:hypothetical protein
LLSIGKLRGYISLVDRILVFMIVERIKNSIRGLEECVFSADVLCYAVERNCGDGRAKAAANNHLGFILQVMIFELKFHSLLHIL